ncbi:hypothetical protein G6L91_11515 [Agrobacterium rhizogenes]|jgi:hypothetical protein|uniref:hypothetical protein n=1 Tax=Rhizobium rhizogenes TaxID=359 RepID=UPI001571B8F4|nr:hypothetical protein [Rhizobium rhizogenes]NTF62095.1 hypothetical protein [Rhizobium rhizogenes]
MDTIEANQAPPCTQATSTAQASDEKVIVVETRITVRACGDAVIYDFNTDGAPSSPGYDWNS